MRRQRRTGDRLWNIPIARNVRVREPNMEPVGSTTHQSTVRLPAKRKRAGMSKSSLRHAVDAVHAPLPTSGVAVDACEWWMALAGRESSKLCMHNQSCTLTRVSQAPTRRLGASQLQPPSPPSPSVFVQLVTVALRQVCRRRKPVLHPRRAWLRLVATVMTPLARRLRGWSAPSIPSAQQVGVLSSVAGCNETRVMLVMTRGEQGVAR